MIFLIVFLCLIASLLLSFIWFKNNRKYTSSKSVSLAYDSWTNDRLLEKLWGEHIHLGYYQDSFSKKDFRQSKIDFVHQLVRWSGFDQLPKGSRVIDVGCGIGGSSRILAEEYGFDVLGITISPEQVKRANQLTPSNLPCQFKVMDALDLKLDNGTFDGVWSIEAGAHMPNKQLFANEMLRILRPGGVLAVADWNQRDIGSSNKTLVEKIVMKQLLNQWSHPEFASIESFKGNLLSSQYCGAPVEIADWTEFTLPSWSESIYEGVRRPNIFFELGPNSFFNGLREIPTILLMRWAFKVGLMRFGVFKTRG